VSWSSCLYGLQLCNIALYTNCNCNSSTAGSTAVVVGDLPVAGECRTVSYFCRYRAAKSFNAATLIYTTCTSQPNHRLTTRRATNVIVGVDQSKTGVYRWKLFADSNQFFFVSLYMRYICYFWTLKISSGFFYSICPTGSRIHVSTKKTRLRLGLGVSWSTKGPHLKISLHYCVPVSKRFWNWTSIHTCRSHLVL